MKTLGRTLASLLFLTNINCSTTEKVGYTMERIDLMPSADNYEFFKVDHIGSDDGFFSKNTDSCIISVLNGQNHKYNVIYWRRDEDSLPSLEFYFSLSEGEKIRDKGGNLPNSIYHTPSKKENIEFEWIADVKNRIFRFFEHIK